MKKIVLAFLVITLIACKNETKEATDSVATEEKVEEQKKELTVSVRFKTNKADKFKLMLNNVVVDELQKKNIHIIEEVSPNSDFDAINANFGENISPNFSISLGNAEVKEVEIESITVTFGANSIQVEPNALKDYFNMNKFVSQDGETFKYRTKRVDGKHAPAITLKRKAINTLQKE